MAGAPNFLPARFAEYNEGDLPKYVSVEWNVEVWLTELDALGCDPVSLNKLLHLNKLDPKLANWILLSFYMRIADGVYSLAPPVRNYSAFLQSTCSKATMSLEDCGEHRKM